MPRMEPVRPDQQVLPPAASHPPAASADGPDRSPDPAALRAAPAAVLLTEGVLTKFLRYVRIDTRSDPAGERVPTTPGQLDLSRLLAAELTELGLEDVELDAHGIVTATLPATPGCESAPTIGLLAHVDTSPAVSGRDVRPLVHRGVDGDPIPLPCGGAVVLPPPGVRGLDLVTSDGSTLLGADDKAGVAEIMEALCRLLVRPVQPAAAAVAPGVPHGRLRVAFTTDEETGRGVDHLDIERFGAAAAYTLDGSLPGEVEAENFNAENLRLRIEGRSAHPGTARGEMVNAVHLAALFAAALPAAERPETTGGREGFYHVDEIAGNAEAVELTLLLRDFDAAGLQRRRDYVTQSLDALTGGHPGSRVTVERTGGYDNMAPALQRSPEVVRLALEAVRATGLEPSLHAIRGGTDGAKLTARGLPTPNLPTGAGAFHSRSEWVCVQWMERSVDLAVQLARLWSVSR